MLERQFLSEETKRKLAEACDQNQGEIKGVIIEGKEIILVNGKKIFEKNDEQSEIKVQ